jgi:hypothetical protein
MTHPIDQLGKANVVEWRKDFYRTLKDLVGQTKEIDPQKYTLNYCLFEYEGKNYRKAAQLEAERHYQISFDL